MPRFVATVVLLAGCAANESALPTLAPAPPGAEEACPEALLGPVTLQEQPATPESPVVAITETGDPVMLVWARGFTGDFGPLVIRDGSGAIVAEGKDTVWLTGGSSADGRYFVCEVSRTEP